MTRMAVLVLAVAFPLMAQAGTEGTAHQYRGWIENQTLSINEPVEGATEGSVVIGGDAIYKARFCRDDSDYFCFFSQSYAFAVPKHLENGVRSWTVEGVTFEVVREGIEVSLFGSRLSGLLLIKLPAGAEYASEPTDRDTFYLYSPERGLVAFGFDPAYPYAATYWMVERSGFASRRRVARSDGDSPTDR